jgi:8-oxo-dGTP pyrophosphatase MutT (NUDIX family)
MKQRFKFIPAVYLILKSKDGNKILLSRRANTGYKDGFYSMVAGHLEGDEPLAVALAREAKEEAGIDIDPKDLRLVTTMHLRSEIKGTTDDERVTFYFETNKYSGELQNMEPHKCDEVEWFDLNDLPEPIIGHVAVAIENAKKGISYAEYGWADGEEF